MAFKVTVAVVRWAPFFSPSLPSSAQHHECYVPSELRVFEMVITADMEYPLICVDVRPGYEPHTLQLDMINLVSPDSCLCGTGTQTDLSDLHPQPQPLTRRPTEPRTPHPATADTPRTAYTPRGIPGQIDQKIIKLTPSCFQKNLKLGLWGSLVAWRRLCQY